MQLEKVDLKSSVCSLPKNLRQVLEMPRWENQVFIGGGYIRSMCSGEPVSDIDLFVKSKEEARNLLAYLSSGYIIIETERALTIPGPVPIQIIHQWVFDNPQEVICSFDFTVCCAVVFFDGLWESLISKEFYNDLDNKELVYRNPIRKHDIGGSLLRVLKYTKKGYFINLANLSAVVTRLVKGRDFTSISDDSIQSELMQLLVESYSSLPAMPL